MAEDVDQETVDQLDQWSQQQASPDWYQPEPSYTGESANQPPQIYNGPERNQQALPESAFRSFGDGSGGGTLDPNATGRALPDEVMIRHTEQQLGTMQLSQAERLRLQRLQNAQSTLQQELAAGNITPQMAQQLGGQVGQQMQPLMIRASQLPTYQRLLQFQLGRQQLIHATAADNENSAFRSRTIEQRTQHVTTPDGGTATIIENGGGRPPTVIDRPGGQGATARPTITPQMQNSAIDAATRRIDRRIQDGEMEAGGRAEAIEQDAREHLQILQRLQGGQTGAAEQPTQRAGAAPAERIRQDGTTYPNPNARGQAAPAQQPQRIEPRQINEDGSNASGQQRAVLRQMQMLREQVPAAMHGAVEQVRTIYARYGDARAMPPEVARDFTQLVTRLDQAAQEQARNRPRPTPQRSVAQPDPTAHIGW